VAVGWALAVLENPWLLWAFFLYLFLFLDRETRLGVIVEEEGVCLGYRLSPIQVCSNSSTRISLLWF
jgi:hypothetical protein